MGLKLIIFLGLLVGVLYCLHILAKDYQAISASKLFRLSKRDVNSTSIHKPAVRWRMALKYDPIQCARHLYCSLGAQLLDNELQRGFIYMLTLKPKDEDKSALGVFKNAYFLGKRHNHPAVCSEKYPLCPFKTKLLLDFIKYQLSNN